MQRKRIAVIESGAPGIDSLDACFILAGLGPLSISSYLARQGYEVKFFAMCASPRLDEDYIRSCDYVLFSVMTHTAKIAYRMADKLRSERRERPVVIIGGVHAGVLTEDALEHCDYAVINEGEASVAELLAHLDSGAPGVPHHVQGIAFRAADGSVVRTPPRQFMGEIDFPLDPKLIYEYPSIWRDFMNTGRFRWPMALVNFSRGCPYACSFCLGMRQLGKVYRTREHETVIEDLTRYHQVTGMGYTLFHDNEFTINRRKTKELLRAIIEKKPPMHSFTVFARIECSEDEELWELFERAGVGVVIFGVESLNQSTLDGFIKRTDVNEIYAALERIERFNVNIVPSFILGDVEDPLREMALITAFRKEFHHKIQRVVIAPLMEYPHQTRLHGQPQLIPDEQFIHHDWDFYSGDFLFFYPRALPPSVFQQALLDTIKANMTIPSSRLWDPASHVSQWLLRYAYGPTERRIRRYIEWLKVVERGKYDHHGHLIRAALYREPKPHTLQDMAA